MSDAPSRNGRLFLVPVGLGSEDDSPFLPAATLEIARRLDAFIVEHPKSARRFLKAIGHPRPLREIPLQVLDARSDRRAVESALALLEKGTDCGLLSEAGCPAVADPGARLVRRAHARGIPVIPLVGPSAILLALMASGMDGQRFAFHGYLPVNSVERARTLRALDARAHERTQVFIETPYRGPAIFSAVLETCRGDTLFCVAADLTLPGQVIATRRVSEWKKSRPDLARRPAVFLLWRDSGRP